MKKSSFQRKILVSHQHSRRRNNGSCTSTINLPVCKIQHFCGMDLFCFESSSHKTSEQVIYGEEGEIVSFQHSHYRSKCTHSNYQFNMYSYVTVSCDQLLICGSINRKDRNQHLTLLFFDLFFSGIFVGDIQIHLHNLLFIKSYQRHQTNCKRWFCWDFPSREETLQKSEILVPVLSIRSPPPSLPNHSKEAIGGATMYIGRLPFIPLCKSRRKDLDIV